MALHTNLAVRGYCGEMGVDAWTETDWHRELQANQVLVMTAQIFLDILLHGFMPLHKVRSGSGHGCREVSKVTQRAQ